MKIERDNLRIRSAEVEDAEMLCTWWNDGRVMAHAGFPKGLSTTVERVESKLRERVDNKERLILELDSYPIGEMCYEAVDKDSVDIGIKICDFSKQESGHGTKYLKMLIDYLFTEKSFEKIVLDTNLSNKRAQHVYEKIGFKKKNIKVDSWKDQLGVLQSAVEYELSKEDFYRE